MSLEYDLTEGLDPTPLSSISASQLLQMIRQAAPHSNKGFIIYSSLKPDTTNNPRYKTFFWVDISKNPNQVNYWDTVLGDYTPVTAGNASVSTASIQNQAVTPAKIQPGPASTFLQTDVGQNVVWAPFAIQDGTLPITKLVKPTVALAVLRLKADKSALEWAFINPLDYLNGIPPAFIENTGGAGGYVLTLDSTLTPTWIAIPNAVPDHSITTNKIAAGLAKSVLQTNATGDGVEWTTGVTAVVSSFFGVGPTWDVTVTKPANTRWKFFDLLFVANAVGSNSPPFGSIQIDFTYQTAPVIGTVPGAGASGLNYTDLIAVVGSPVWGQAGNIAPQLQDVATVAFRATATINSGTTLRAGCNLIAKAYYL